MFSSATACACGIFGFAYRFTTKMYCFRGIESGAIGSAMWGCKALVCIAGSAGLLAGGAIAVSLNAPTWATIFTMFACASLSVCGCQCCIYCTCCNDDIDCSPLIDDTDWQYLNSVQNNERQTLLSIL